MASKNIAVREDLYDKLSRIKQPNESFSDVIERLLDEGQKGSFGWIKPYIGIWRDMPPEFFNIMQEARASFDAEMEERLKRVRS